MGHIRRVNAAGPDTIVDLPKQRPLTKRGAAPFEAPWGNLETFQSDLWHLAERMTAGLSEQERLRLRRVLTIYGYRGVFADALDAMAREEEEEEVG